METYLGELLENELAYRATEAGMERVTVAELDSRLEMIGYKRIPHSACKCNARYMTGPRAGKAYPCCTYGVMEADTRRSAFHVNSRRDARFLELQAMRAQAVYAVHAGYIIEI